MARFPTYRRGSQLSASITRPPNVDQAALRETARGAQSLANNAQRVVQFATKELETKAKAEGVRAGLADPTGTLRGSGGERPTYSVYEQAAFDAAVSVASVDIETAAKTEMQNAWLRYQKDKGDPQDLAQELADIRNGYAQSMNDLDPLTAAKLNRKLESSAQSVFLDYSTDHLKREQKRLDGQGVTLFSDTQRQVELLGRQTGDETELSNVIADFTESMEALGQTGTAAFAADIEKLKTRFHRARVRGEFDRAKSVGNADQYIEKFQADLDKGKGLARGLLEEGKKVLGNEMADYMRSELAASRAAATAAKKQLKADIKEVRGDANVISKTIQDNLIVGQDRIDKLVQDARATGDPELIADVSNLVALRDYHKEHRGMPPKVLRQMAEKMRAEAKRDGDTNEYERDRIKFLDQMANRAEKMRDKPVEFYKEINDNRELPPISLANPAGMRDRVEQINNFSARMYGVPSKVFLSDAEKADLSQTLSTATVAEQMLAFRNIAAGFGNHAIDVLRQIAPKNPVAANVGALLTITGNKDFAETVLRGQAARKPEQGGVSAFDLDSTEKKDLEAHVETRLAGAGVPSEDIARGKATILAYAVGKKLEGSDFDASKNDDLNLAIQQSQGAAVVQGEHIAGGIQEYNGSKVVVPQSVIVDEDDPNSLKSLFEGAVVVQSAAVPSAYGAGRRSKKIEGPLTSEDFDALGIRPYVNGKPYPVDERLYENMTLRTMDGARVGLMYNGKPLVGRNGMPITVDLNELVAYRADQRAGLLD